MTQKPPPTMVVHKYPLPIPEGPAGTLGRIELPLGATILRIGWKPGPSRILRKEEWHQVAPHAEFYLWAIICTTVEKKEQRFYAALETGQEFSAKTLADLVMIAAAVGEPEPFARSETVLAMDGRYVVHFLLSHPGEVK